MAVLQSKNFHPKNGLPKVMEKFHPTKIFTPQNDCQVKKFPPQKWSPKSDKKKYQLQKKILWTLDTLQNGCPPLKKFPP